MVFVNRDDGFGCGIDCGMSFLYASSSTVDCVAIGASQFSVLEV
jgi:hypothetical protein